MYLLRNNSEVFTTVFQSQFNECLSQYDGYTCTFTDVSMIREPVGAAAIVESRVSKKRLSNNSPIFSSEARPRVTTGTRHVTLVTCACLTLICVCKFFNIKTSHTLSLQRFYVACMDCYISGISVVFMWVFSDVGLAGNSAADIAATCSFMPAVTA